MKIEPTDCPPCVDFRCFFRLKAECYAMEFFLVCSLFATLFVMIGAVVDDFVRRSRHQRRTVRAQMPDCEPPPREPVPHDFEDGKLPYDEAA